MVLAQVELMVEPVNRTDTWPGLELRHLAALAAVDRAGSFGRAATELGYTQSAVSQQIAGLERIVGVKLLERPGSARRATPTEAGRTLLRHAVAITARLAAARADIAALRAGESGSLRVGTYQSIGARLLPAVMRRFLEDWPAVEIGLTEPATDAEFATLLENGELDLALCSLPLPDGPFDAVELMNDPYILLVPAAGRFEGRDTLSLGELDTTPIVGCSATGVKLENALRATGHTLEFAFRSDNNGTLQGLVAAGFGIALVPLLAVGPGDAHVRIVQLEELVPPRRLAVAWHRDRHRSAAARAFVDVAREVSAELQRELVPA